MALHNPNGSSNISGKYDKISYLNFGNEPKNDRNYTSTSFMDAMGAAMAMYTGFTAVIGRIGLGHIFLLSFLGTFGYELNSSLLWRLYVPDNGYPFRAFAYGGALGIMSSYLLYQKDLTIFSANYRSSYILRVIPMIGVTIFWATYPIMMLSSTYNRMQVDGFTNTRGTRVIG